MHVYVWVCVCVCDRHILWHMRGIDDAVAADVAVACRKDIAKHCDKNPFRCANKQKSTRKLTLMSDDNDRETARQPDWQAGRHISETGTHICA